MPLVSASWSCVHYQTLSCSTIGNSCTNHHPHNSDSSTKRSRNWHQMQQKLLWWPKTSTATFWRRRSSYQRSRILRRTRRGAAVMSCRHSNAPKVISETPLYLRLYNRVLLGTVSIRIFHAQFKYNGKFSLLYFHFWSSDCNKILHMPRQHSCRVMCKVL